MALSSEPKRKGSRVPAGLTGALHATGQEEILCLWVLCFMTHILPYHLTPGHGGHIMELNVTGACHRLRSGSRKRGRPFNQDPAVRSGPEDGEWENARREW
jgi:hypothetical protein